MTDMTGEERLNEDEAVRLVQAREWDFRMQGAAWLATHAAERHSLQLVALMVDDPNTAVSEAVAEALLERGDDLGVELFIRAHVASAGNDLGAGDDLYEAWWSYLHQTERPLGELIALVRTAWNAAETSEDRTALTELLTAADATE